MRLNRACQGQLQYLEPKHRGRLSVSWKTSRNADRTPRVTSLIPLVDLCIYVQPLLSGIPRLCHGAWIDQSFSEHLEASRDEALVSSTEFFFSPCAPHTPCTPGRLPERAAPKCTRPEPVDLTWKTDWARPPQQVRKSDAGT